MPLAILFRFAGGLRLRRSERRHDRRQVDLGERARNCQSLAALWRARAVEGADRGKGGAFENAASRRPQITFAALQAWQIAEDALAFVAVSLALDPPADRVAVLARRQFHRDQNVGLREHILMHYGRPLRDQPRNETPDPATADNFLDV